VRVAASLAAYAIVLAVAAPWVLSRLTRSGRAPRLGVAAWMLACAGAVGSWVFAGLVLLTPRAVPEANLGRLLSACITVVEQALDTPRSGAAWLAGLAASLAVAGRVLWCLASAAVTAHRQRAGHRETLRMVGRPAPGGIPATILDADRPVVYCLPGRPASVVVSSAALAALDGPQLSAVLAHERAHLAGRHHLALIALRSLRRALPFLPLFRSAAAEVARLLEMRADDVAARRHAGTAIAQALLALSDRPAPVAAIGAGGPTAIARALRLVEPASLPNRARAAAALSLTVAALATGPAFASSLPLLAHLGHQWCPLL